MAKMAGFLARGYVAIHFPEGCASVLLTGSCPHLYVGIAWLTVITTKLLERVGEKEKRKKGGNKNMF